MLLKEHAPHPEMNLYFLIILQSLLLIIQFFQKVILITTTKILNSQDML